MKRETHKAFDLQRIAMSVQHILEEIDRDQSDVFVLFPAMTYCEEHHDLS